MQLTKENSIGKFITFNILFSYTTLKESGTIRFKILCMYSKYVIENIL